MQTRVAFLLTFACLAACDNPQEPCSRPHACEFAGEHLVIESIAFETAGTDPVDHLLLAKGPLGIAVNVEIRNRGDTASLPLTLSASTRNLWVEDSLPSLEPGALVKRTLIIPFRGPAILQDSDLVTVDVYLFRQDNQSGEWSEVTHRTGDPVHVLVPAVRITISANSDTLVFGRAAPISLTVANTSRTEFAASPLYFGLWNEPDSDVPFPAWQPISIPSLRAGSSYTLANPVVVAPNAGYLNGPGWTYALYACMALDTAHGSFGDLVHTDADGPCGRQRNVPGVPDLAACATAVAQTGQVVLADHQCDGSSPRWAFWSIDVRAHIRYRFLQPDGTKQDGVLIRARDGSGIAGSNVFGVNDWEAPRTERVYLALQFPPTEAKLLVQELTP